MAEILAVDVIPGDPLPLSRIITSGGVAPYTYNFTWEVAPSAPAQPAVTFSIDPTMNQILITTDVTSVAGQTYTGSVRGEVTDANGNVLVRILPLSATFAVI